MTIRIDKLDTVTHVCAVDAYLEIFDHGLRSTDQLLRDHGYSDEERIALTTAPRPESIELKPNGDLGPVTLPHNQALLASGQQGYLQKSLAKSGNTLEEYCALLNSRVYLWADFRYEDGEAVGDAPAFPERVAVDGEFDVIRIPFISLKRAAEKQSREVELSDLYSGSAPSSITRRGRNTWTPLADYARNGVVQEVTVLDRLDDVATFARSVVRFGPSGPKPVWIGGPWR